MTNATAQKPVVDFLGIGAQKAGTTWLFEMLSKHPDVFFPTKEIHYWDMFQERGLEWYESLFTPGEGKVRGEITPAYGILDVADIKKVKAHTPEVKLIFIARNPIDRAWSSALMALKRAEMQLHEASDAWFIDHFNSEGSRKRGDYARCITNWLSVFDERQLLVIRHEDISRRPHLVLSRVASHIGISDTPFKQLGNDVLSQKVFEGTATPLRPSLKPELERLYAAPMLEAEKLLSRWNTAES